MLHCYMCNEYNTILYIQLHTYMPAYKINIENNFKINERVKK